MLKFEEAVNNDVDLLLDIKLDIIFNSEEIMKLSKYEMEKIVNYTEEDIRENLKSYKIVYEGTNIVGVYSVLDYTEESCLIDIIYVKPEYRSKGIGTDILNKIIGSTYKKINLWIYKNNELAINFYKKLGFLIIEESEGRYFMENKNEKELNSSIKANLFAEEVKKIAKKYNVEYIFITEKNSEMYYEKSNLIKLIYENYSKYINENKE